jgi:hypothetical protein
MTAKGEVDPIDARWRSEGRPIPEMSYVEDNWTGHGMSVDCLY